MCRTVAASDVRPEGPALGPQEASDGAGVGRLARHELPVARVGAAGLDAHPDLARAGCGHRDLLDRQVLFVAVTVLDECAHSASSTLAHAYQRTFWQPVGGGTKAGLVLDRTLARDYLRWLTAQAPFTTITRNGSAGMTQRMPGPAASSPLSSMSTAPGSASTAVAVSGSSGK